MKGLAVNPGDKCNYLTAIEVKKFEGCKKVHHDVYKVHYRCVCGKEGWCQKSYFIHGKVKSCGCMTRKTHGYSKTRLYRVWASIKYRCCIETSKDFYLYGGRGIKMFEEWKDSFTAFKAWADANGYKEGLSIDRINSDGDYCPENCRWATVEEQANNKRSNVRIEYKGKVYTVAELARETGISYGTLQRRLREGFSLDDALVKGDIRDYRKQRGLRVVAKYEYGYKRKKNGTLKRDLRSK